MELDYFMDANGAGVKEHQLQEAITKEDRVESGEDSSELEGTVAIMQEGGTGEGFKHRDYNVELKNAMDLSDESDAFAASSEDKFAFELGEENESVSSDDGDNSSDYELDTLNDEMNRTVRLRDLSAILPQPFSVSPDDVEKVVQKILQDQGDKNVVFAQSRPRVESDTLKGQLLCDDVANVTTSECDGYSSDIESFETAEFCSDEQLSQPTESWSGTQLAVNATMLLFTFCAVVPLLFLKTGMNSVASAIRRIRKK
uniref:Uncharacterized protein n=1 Tax=Spongospora subterranea TaxID=70186 RepID=A0A0H5R8I0_9EUKA|eukprot:CRZ10022.1 hypothetical protein [Spongospora subterranea]